MNLSFIENSFLIQLLFHPVLWTMPLIVTVLVSAYQVLRYGITNARFDFNPRFQQLVSRDKQYSSLNVLMFSLMWIWSIYVFSLMELSNMVRVFLCFCTIFSVYGIGELLARVIWFRNKIGKFGVVPTVKSMMYPLFFLFNNIPLYMFIKNLEVTRLNFDIFMIMQVLHLGIWIVHGYLVSKYQLDYVVPRLYYLTRIVAILSYAIFLGGYVKW